jgi:hypothetical protein
MDIRTQQDSSKQPSRKLPRNIGKILLGSAIIFMAAGFSFDAEARGHGYRYYGGHNGGHGYGHGYRHGSGHHGSHDGAYLVGGLVLGSLISHAYHRRQDPYVVRETRVVHRTSERTSERPVGRRLYKDRNGDCFERNYNAAGDEILVELDPNECAW